MLQIRGTSCCGMREIEDIGGDGKTATDALRQFCLNLPMVYDYGKRSSGGGFKILNREVSFSLVVFTGVVGRERTDNSSGRADNYGEAFAQLLAAEKLRVVTPSVGGVNPNTNNTIQAWVWTVDRDALVAYAQRIDAEEEEKRAHELRRTAAARPQGGPEAGTYGAITRSEESPSWAQQRIGPGEYLVYGRRAGRNTRVVNPDINEVFRNTYAGIFGDWLGNHPLRDDHRRQNAPIRPQPDAPPSGGTDSPDRAE